MEKRKKIREIEEYIDSLLDDNGVIHIENKAERLLIDALKIIKGDFDYIEPADGVIAIPRPKNVPNYNMHKLFEYCDEKGIKPMDLTREERKQFIIKDK
ncbi:hypothetical protein AB3N02_21675 [Priestia aryabhattai]|uniref:hypothetical protein n=1 Tax=Priestia aryabhattai TaxID=412384 RepID=UPI0039A09470